MINGIVKAVRKIVSKKTRKTAAVIVAAGSSSRMKGIDKIFANLGDEPLIVSALRTFNDCSEINEIVVVCSAENIERMYTICRLHEFSKVSSCVAGGTTRTDSSNIGVAAVDKKTDIIVIHDGARPFVTDEMIKLSVEEAARTGCATCAIPVTSTVKRAKNGIITETVDREDLYEIQTPQAFQTVVIKAALKNALENKLNITDDCMAAEAIGAKPRIVNGSRYNIKITVEEDLDIANSFVKYGRVK